MVANIPPIPLLGVVHVLWAMCLDRVFCRIRCLQDLQQGTGTCGRNIEHRTLGKFCHQKFLEMFVVPKMLFFFGQWSAMIHCDN